MTCLSDTIRNLFKRKPTIPQASDKMISQIIATEHITRVDNKPYFTIGDAVWSFNGGDLICVNNGGRVAITPTDHMFLNAHLNTVPVVRVH